MQHERAQRNQGELRPVGVTQGLCDWFDREGRKKSRDASASNRRWRSMDQITRKLAAGHEQLAADNELGEVCGHLKAGVDVASVARQVRRDVGQRCETWWCVAV